ncbi:hypothetical protein [Pseudoclavibacter caeni]|jgi:hypothetical protein|uniref:Uncharacterized protein n=1 Tax=Pseudoclavibacter caeni TaxID=908846 RepID=A0A7C8FI66_9MICO|nr:hypothetical protein [Pseudoclavibacter caeni]KAB1631718.1 hypothetical protein F8O02_07195 [Pseudoclavibacter caeni]NYJ97349.1 hypothetical protein [Pseudoclavibacter caeni]
MNARRDDQHNRARAAAARRDAAHDADLEQLWQDESPSTARHTEVADQVDGELGTRRRADRDPEQGADGVAGR